MTAAAARLSSGNLSRALVLSVAIVATVFGVAMRFYQIPTHGFWGDEGITALRVAGHTSADFIRLTTARDVPAAQIKAMERVTVSSSPAAVVQSLAAEDTHHPPLYYLLGYAWERAVHAGPLSLRALSVLLSLLLLPAVYWLVYEMLGSRMMAATAMALAAVSPYNIEYAQQAREYALWAVLVCVASALLLRGLRETRIAWWVLYAAAMCAGYYTHTFMLLVLVAHAAYVLAVRKSLEKGTVRRFFVATGISLLVFVPWLLVIARQYGQVSGYGVSGYESQSVKAAAYAWIVALATPFVDLEFLALKYFLPVGLILAAEIAAAVAAIRGMKPSASLLLICLFAAGALLQIGNRGFVDMPRYLVPTMLALQLAVACWPFLYAKGSSRAAIAYCGLCAVMLICAYDDVTRAGSRIWWTNYYGEPLTPIAARVDAAGNATVAGTAKDWEVTYDEALQLRNTDAVMLDPSASAIRADIANGRHVFALSRFRALALAVGSGFRMTPMPVAVRPHGYALISREKGEAVRTQALWLWSIASR